MAPLKVFAFDYVTEGGPTARALPHSFTQQGSMLRDALLADLGALPGVEVCTMAALDGAAARGTAARSFGERFAACVEAADAVWPLAPESEGRLESLSRDVLRGKRILLGSAPGAVRVAGSKLKVARALAQGGVATVPTYRPHAALPEGEGAWVVKPEDGAGCLDTRLFSDRAAALAWIRTSAAQGYVLQPFIAGKLVSLSLICCDGTARLLARNQERVAVRDNRFHFLGSTVNGLADADGALERLAQQVAAALPTLWGYVGVDIILSERGAVVLDVNPRLTAAYAGLHASIGCNPAGLVIDLLKGPAAMPAPLTRQRPVSVDVGSFPGDAPA
jgi:predicted ATP-grasp superfamily ATP-dependent carboligase